MGVDKIILFIKYFLNIHCISGPTDKQGKGNLQSTYSQVTYAVIEPSGGWHFRKAFLEEVNSESEKDRD